MEKRGGDGGAARGDGPKKHHHRFPHYKRDGQPIRIRYYYVLHIREGKKKRGFFKYIFLFFVPRCYATIQSFSFTLCLNPQYLVLPHAEHSFKGEKESKQQQLLYMYTWLFPRQNDIENKRKISQIDDWIDTCCFALRRRIFISTSEMITAREIV